MKVLYAESDFWGQHKSFIQKYEAEVEKAYELCRKLLSNLSDSITFVVQASDTESIPELGLGAWAKNAELIILAIDPGIPYGEKETLTRVRGLVFHELNHTVRLKAGLWQKSFIDNCVFEGLGTAFERDFAKSAPLWGIYKKNEAKEWLEEVSSVAANDHYDYMYRHADGRRWIGYKVGTYIVDQAKEISGKSIPELTTLDYVEIKQLAGIKE
jgi:uncharacterized protein YjaZ